jgi:hypothetical protein
MPTVIDVHHHILPDISSSVRRMMTRTKLAVSDQRHGAKPALWNSWDDAGIDAAISRSRRRGFISGLCAGTKPRDPGSAHHKAEIEKGWPIMRAAGIRAD